MDNDSGKPQIAIGRVPYRPEVNVRSVEEDISRRPRVSTIADGCLDSARPDTWIRATFH